MTVTRELQEIDNMIYKLRMKRDQLDTYQAYEVNKRLNQLRKKRESLLKKAEKGSEAKVNQRALYEGFPFKRDDIIAHLAAGNTLRGVSV